MLPQYANKQTIDKGPIASTLIDGTDQSWNRNMAAEGPGIDDD